MSRNIVNSEDSRESGEYKKEKFVKNRELENQNIRRLLSTSAGKRYVLRQLKRAFVLDGGSLCSNEAGTFYNLGKFESYLEILLDLREAYSEVGEAGREDVAEVILGWFFDTEIE